MKDIPWSIEGLGELSFIWASFNPAFTRFNEEGFFFFSMVLEAQGFAFFYKKDFSNILASLSPKKFVTPGLIGFMDGSFLIF